MSFRFSEAHHNYLAEKHSVSVSTIRRNIMRLIETKQVVKVYRRNPKGNSLGKPIYLFTHHPNFNLVINCRLN